MKPAVFLPEAYDEMLAAAQFYEATSQGLGEAFLLALNSAIHDVQENPARWPIMGTTVRRRHLGRFPYGILYSEESERIVIVAVMHLHRRPGYWRDRRA